MDFLNKLALSLLFFFPAMLMSIQNGGSAILLLLLVISLGYLTLNRSKQFYELDRHESQFLMVIFIYVAVYVFNVWYFNSSISSLDNALQILLIIPIFVVIRQIKLHQTFFYYSILLSALACFFIAIYQYYFLNIIRPLGVTNMVAFGGLSMTIAMMCFGIALLSKLKQIKLLFFIGFLLALYAAILSGSRGSWFILLSGVLALFLINPVGWSFKSRFFGLILIFISIVSSYFISSIQSRVDLAVKEVNAYTQKGNANSSVGVRLELWRAALLVSSENPLMGIGEGNFKKKMEELVAAKKVDSNVLWTGHVHQEYLSALLNRGVLGLLSLLFIFLFPLVYFVRKLKSSENKDQRVLSMLGLILITSAMTISFTDVYFLQHKNMLFYFTFIFMVFAHLKQVENQGNEQPKLI